MDFYNAQMFDFQKIYDQVADGATSDSVFLEIGANMGHSTIHMARLAKEKGFLFYTVDPWTYPPMPIIENAHIFNRLAQLPKQVAPYLLFLENLKKEGLLRYVTPLKCLSTQASLLFQNELDFVMIDGDHEYSSVCEDIDSWMPKIKEGGVLAGHDYTFPEVKKAVDERFDAFLYEQRNSTTLLFHSICWSVQKINGEFIPYRIGE